MVLRLAQIFSLFIVCAFFHYVPEAQADINLHEIDSNSQNGFAIYRLGQPKKMDMRSLCQRGITEMMVLSGTAEEAEFKYQSDCPGLKVVYNIEQNSKVPLDAAFLQQFEQWVEEAQLQGKKIAFRCECGCHRTGRLAAYYNMKYLGWDVERALSDMNDKGKVMRFFRHLIPQVRDLEDYIQGRPCVQGPEFCVDRSAVN